ncbi:MAG: crossover junction endodeoxyribonuclease RuvC [Microgenomates group bacterium]
MKVIIKDVIIRKMIILGIDPGIAITGYGLIKCNSKKITLVDLGSIKTSKNLASPQRLDLIYSQTAKIIRNHKPQVLALESLFFNTNAKSASAVGQAMGVIKLAAAKKKIEVVEYPPLKIKMVLTENGRAKKNHIQSKVRKILKLKKLPRPTHAADALAVAICHWKVKNDKIKGIPSPKTLEDQRR